MTQIISILNHKGGVGKTTTTVNFGAGLIRQGKKVLFVDADGQANLTESLGFVKLTNSDKTLYDAMKATKDEVYSLPITTNKQGYDLVPSSLDLSAVDMELNAEAGREFILSNLLKTVNNKYDYILIDCPPALGLLTLNALTASNSVIIPVQSQYLALRGLQKLMDIYNKVKQRLNKSIEIDGFLITKFSPTKKLDKNVVELVKKHFGTKVFDTIIRENTQLAEAPVKGEDIFSYAPKSNGAIDYNNFVNEFLKNNN